MPGQSQAALSRVPGQASSYLTSRCQEDDVAMGQIVTGYTTVIAIFLCNVGCICCISWLHLWQAIPIYLSIYT